MCSKFGNLELVSQTSQARSWFPGYFQKFQFCHGISGNNRQPMLNVFWETLFLDKFSQMPIYIDQDCRLYPA